MLVHTQPCFPVSHSAPALARQTLPESSTLRSDAGKYFHELRQCIARFEEPAAWAICALHSIRWVVRMHRVEPVGRHQTLQVTTCCCCT